MKLKHTVWLLILGLCFSRLHAQEPVKKDSISQEISDSIFLDKALLEDLKSMLDSMSRKISFFSVSVGAGYRLFSVKNNNFNAQQAINRIALTPSVFYFHKSGFGINAIAYLSSPEDRPEFYQYAFTPSYDYLGGKKISFGISYSYYLKEKDLRQYATPFNHELFVYIQTRKGWLRTGISAGWGTGSYSEISQADTLIFNIPRRLTDTTNIGLQDFSLTALVSHPFEWDEIFSSNDGISFIPQLMLVAGSQQYDIDSRKRLISNRKYRIVNRIYNSASTENTGFRIQSAAFAVNLSYYFGGFSISPGYFFSYYFPETDKHISNIFSVTAAYMF